LPIRAEFAGQHLGSLSFFFREFGFERWTDRELAFEGVFLALTI
jgi:hypothetical protein